MGAPPGGHGASGLGGTSSFMPGTIPEPSTPGRPGGGVADRGDGNCSLGLGGGGGMVFGRSAGFGVSIAFGIALIGGNVGGVNSRIGGAGGSTGAADVARYTGSVEAGAGTDEPSGGMSTGYRIAGFQFDGSIGVAAGVDVAVIVGAEIAVTVGVVGTAGTATGTVEMGGGVVGAGIGSFDFQFASSARAAWEINPKAESSSIARTRFMPRPPPNRAESNSSSG